MNTNAIPIEDLSIGNDKTKTELAIFIADTLYLNYTKDRTVSADNHMVKKLVRNGKEYLQKLYRQSVKSRQGKGQETYEIK